MSENIVKQTCKELGLTQKELADDKTKKIKVAKRIISIASTDDLADRFADALSDELDSIVSEKDVRNWLEDKMTSFNIVKHSCSILNISQKQLSVLLEVPQSTVNRWASTNDTPRMAQKYLELMLETKELKENFKILKKAHKILAE